MKVKKGQSVWDVSIKETGSIEAAMEIARLNDIEVTEELEAGTELVIPGVNDQELVDFLKVKKAEPATQID
jgi:LysM repeat protein